MVKEIILRIVDVNDFGKEAGCCVSGSKDHMLGLHFPRNRSEVFPPEISRLMQSA